MALVTEELPWWVMLNARGKVDIGMVSCVRNELRKDDLLKRKPCVKALQFRAKRAIFIKPVV